VQWIMAQELLGFFDGLPEFLVPFQDVYQFLQDPDVSLAQPLPFRDDPIIVAAGQQVAIVGIGCILKSLPEVPVIPGFFSPFSPVEGLLKGIQVNRERGVRLPPERFGAHIQETICFWKGFPEVIEQISEIGVGLGFGGIRPEQIR